MNDSIALPPNATEASRIRYRLALELAQDCPAELGTEIILSGSTAYGLADEYSDLEFCLLVSKLPRPAERSKWLRASAAPRWLEGIGATEITFDDDTTADGSVWATFSFKKTWVEIAWQDIPSREEQLRAILAAEITDHYRLRMTWIMEQALPLKTTGKLAQWQRALARYPDELQRKLIAKATFDWADPHAVNGPSHWGIRRDTGLLFADRLVSDVYDLLRLLFAINRRWETSWKWIRHDTRDLVLKPDRLIERIEHVFSAAVPHARRRECNSLILDTLLLVPKPYDVSKAIATIEGSLRTHSG